MNRGQLELPLIIGLMAFLLVVVMSSFIMNEEVKETARLETGGYSEIAAASVKAEAYTERMSKELNYSSNIIALELGSNGGGASWDNNIPSESDLRQQYTSSTREELRSQNNVMRCEKPSIEEVNVDSSSDRIEAGLSNPAITCGSANVEAKVSLESDSIEVTNSDNRYLGMSQAAVELGESARELMPESEWESGDGFETTDCYEGGPDREEVLETREDAKDEAKQDAEKDGDIDEDAIDRIDIPDYIEIESSTSFEYSTSTSAESVECTKREPRECRDVEEREDRSDECFENIDGTKSQFDSEATVNQIEVDFDLTDSEKTVINSNAEQEPISFDFNYIHDLG